MNHFGLEVHKSLKIYYLDGAWLSRWSLFQRIFSGSPYSENILFFDPHNMIVQNIRSLDYSTPGYRVKFNLQPNNLLAKINRDRLCVQYYNNIMYI